MESWDKFILEIRPMVNEPCESTPFLTGVEAQDCKYILNQYELTYRQLASAKRQVSQIQQLNQVVLALQPGTARSWSGFIAKVPSIIEGCFAYWPRIVPSAELQPIQSDLEVVCSSAWLSKIELLTSHIERHEEAFRFDALSGSSDSEDEQPLPLEARVKVERYGHVFTPLRTDADN